MDSVPPIQAGVLTSSLDYVEFLLDNLRIAFALENIQRVTRAVTVAPVFGPARWGVIAVHGVMPVVRHSRAARPSLLADARPSDYTMIVADQVASTVRRSRNPRFLWGRP